MCHRAKHFTWIIITLTHTSPMKKVLLQITDNRIKHKLQCSMQSCSLPAPKPPPSPCPLSMPLLYTHAVLFAKHPTHCYIHMPSSYLLAFLGVTLMFQFLKSLSVPLQMKIAFECRISHLKIKIVLLLEETGLTFPFT